MTLYDFVIMEKTDFDTYDTVFDVEVTVCVPNDDESDYYDKFYNFIIRHVEFVEKTSKYECTAEWTKFITDNIDVFRMAARRMWHEETVPKTDDDLIYEWIKEINGWLAGYVSETEYAEFMENYAPMIRDI